MAAKTVPREPKSSQERPKTPPRRPQSAPRRPKTPPRSPLDTVLEPSWDQQSARSKTRSKIVNRWRPFASILAPKTTPQTTPRRPQNETKIKTKNTSLFYRSWTRLRSVLRRSWDHLGGIFCDFALVFPMFFEHRHFRTNDGSRRIFGPT